MNIHSLLQQSDYKQKFVLEKLIQVHLGLTREQLRLHLDDELTDQQIHHIQQDYHAHTVEKKPLEYILGHVDFFEVPFYVNEHTIIPRPETEYMITAVTERIQQQKKSDDGILIDIGTGSGVLGISVLLQNPHSFQQVYFTDISEEALNVAKKNYDTLITHPEHYHPHFLQVNLADFAIPPQGEIILVANLPYIPDETFDTNALENVQKWEPRLAFVGGADGLDLYREMFKQLLSCEQPLSSSCKGELVPHKLQDETKCQRDQKVQKGNIIMFLEMMTRQVDILKAEFGERLHFEEVKTFHFNIRIVKARIA
jgi:release factor glutamine methyltransferase